MPFPEKKLPITMQSGDIWPHTMYLKHYINHPNIEVGDFTYYNDFRMKDVDDLRPQIAPYMHPYCPEKLTIGKFVQIAQGTQFITASSGHQMDGFSTYPFATFGEPWSTAYAPKWPNKGDTTVGHDVWFGHESLIMPALNIGSGAIIATRSVVTKDVPPFAIVGGNPAKIIRMRFDDATIEQLLDIAWWDWPIEKITANLPAIVGADIEALKIR